MSAFGQRPNSSRKPPAHLGKKDTIYINTLGSVSTQIEWVKQAPPFLPSHLLQSEHSRSPREEQTNESPARHARG